MCQGCLSSLSVRITHTPARRVQDGEIRCAVLEGTLHLLESLRLGLLIQAGALCQADRVATSACAIDILSSPFVPALGLEPSYAHL